MIICVKEQVIFVIWGGRVLAELQRSQREEIAYPRANNLNWRRDNSLSSC